MIEACLHVFCSVFSYQIQSLSLAILKTEYFYEKITYLQISKIVFRFHTHITNMHLKIAKKYDYRIVF